MMIKGFDRAVADMEIGQIKDIHLMPEEAYGLPDPNAIFHVEISQLPGAEGMLPGGLGPLSLQLVELVVELGELACTAGQFRLLLLQLRDEAHALVDLAAVEPLLELPLHLGVGHILLAGGYQGGDAGLQLRSGADGQGAALTDEGGALIDLPAHAQQHLPAGVGGQAGDGLLGAGVHGGEAAKGHIATRSPPNGNVPCLLYTSPSPRDA